MRIFYLHHVTIDSHINTRNRYIELLWEWLDSSITTGTDKKNLVVFTVASIKNKPMKWIFGTAGEMEWQCCVELYREKVLFLVWLYQCWSRASERKLLFQLKSDFEISREQTRPTIYDISCSVNAYRRKCFLVIATM